MKGKVDQLDNILDLFENKNINQDLLSEIGNVKELIKDNSKENAPDLISDIIDSSIDNSIDRSINIK